MPDSKDVLLKIFNKLLDYYGPRHWWPAKTNFEIIVGAILTQSVSWKNVEKAIGNLQDKGLLNPLSIVECSTEILEEAVRPTRYYRQKAQRLRTFSYFLLESYKGELGRLFSLDAEVLREQLLGIKGIGPETADSIILYGAGHPVFVVDAYTRRIFNRLGFFKEDVTYDEMQNFFMSNLPHDTYLFNEYHALIVAQGNLCCSNLKPRCGECPLLEMCKDTWIKTEYRSQGAWKE
ncbi:MAG: endonuclease III domain-containing protein [Syntrophomonadaceae bacterium]|nr:endonuclease III domain-containing protein [Syntrophomonadaceae bacterium]